MSSLAIDRPSVVDWYLRNRARTRAIFDLIDPSAYYSRPIALRNPIVFYEGHLPAFSIISFLRRGLGRPAGGRAARETVRARHRPGQHGGRRAAQRRQHRLAVTRRGSRLRTRVSTTTSSPRSKTRSFATTGQRCSVREALYTALEHEAMHQETLLYMWHRLPYGQKGSSARAEATRQTCGFRLRESPEPEVLLHAEEPATQFAFPPASRRSAPIAIAFPSDGTTSSTSTASTCPPFEIDVHNVTNAQFLEFVERGRVSRRCDCGRTNTGHGSRRQGIVTRSSGLLRQVRPRPASWIGMFEEIPLPPDWPVYVSQAEAAAYARWKGRRLPTEAEYHRAAFGTPDGVERLIPGERRPPGCRTRELRLRPLRAAAGRDRIPRGASAWGVHDLVGNGWEWTSTIFGPFAGFAPMASYPEYSADFFDGQHYVMKGASSPRRRGS